MFIKCCCTYSQFCALEMIIIDQVLLTLHVVGSFLWKLHGTFHTLEIVGLNQCWAVFRNCTHQWVS